MWLAGAESPPPCAEICTSHGTVLIQTAPSKEDKKASEQRKRAALHVAKPAATPELKAQAPDTCPAPEIQVLHAKHNELENKFNQLSESMSTQFAGVDSKFLRLESSINIMHQETSSALQQLLRAAALTTAAAEPASSAASPLRKKAKD